MEGLLKGPDTRFLKLKHGLLVGMAVLSMAYPFVFIFGASKLSMIILMYAVVASSVSATIFYRPVLPSGRYRVVHAYGEFVDDFMGSDGNMLYFRSHAVSAPSVYLMEKPEENKNQKESLHEYFH